MAIEVTDTGIGISKNDLKKLFKPFSMISSSRGYNPNGVGLGLSLCKQTVERLGGTVWVHSTPDSGSTFGFKVPVDLLGNELF